MKTRNGALIAAVAAIAVLAVVGGGILASRRAPKDSVGTAAAPLPAGRPTSAAAPAPTPPPTRPPTPPPTPPPAPGTQAKSTYPVKVTVDLNKLAKGRAPQAVYVSGRKVISGGQAPVTVPGDGQIMQVIRYADEVWAIVLRDFGYGTNLLRIPHAGAGRPAQVVVDGGTVVGGADGLSAAYGTEPIGAGGVRTAGGTVVYEGAAPGDRRELNRPDDWGVLVMALARDTVYFRSSKSIYSTQTTLYGWNVLTGEVTTLNGVERAVQLNLAATAAVTAEQSGPGYCSSYVDVASGQRKWRTCEYELANYSDAKAFTPSGNTVIYGPPSYRQAGEQFVAALSASSGDLVRRWSGASFQAAIPEDDDHLLIRAATAEGLQAIVRCSISSGRCELTTPLTKTDLLLGA
ncbi:MAG TPA: hypothetical protein VGD34_05210 [Kribbella sp.]